MDSQYLEELAAFAGELAQNAGRVILTHFRKPTAIENKDRSGAYDPVTIADRDAERVMRDLIAQRYPDHGVIGEEHGRHNENADFVWILDPIDGTRAFVVGYPVWGTLIGLHYCGKPVLGVMAQPFIGERFVGFGGKGFRHGPDGITALHTRHCASLAAAAATTTSPDLFTGAGEDAVFAAVHREVMQMRYGGDCYGYCMLAAGQLDVVLETGLQIYDVAALIPIVEGAGGRLTDWSGNDNPQGGQILATGSPALHEIALKAIEQAR